MSKSIKGKLTKMLKLKKGDEIGIFSPSYPITYNAPKRFERAKNYLKDKGFKIVEGNLTGKHDCKK